jgi:hypothetical protein
VTTKQNRAKLASAQLSFELERLAEEIRDVDEDIEDSYLSRELALYRKTLANRATVLSMANSLRRCRLHAEKITVNGATFRFKTLGAQADYLQWVVTTPYSVLTNKQKRHVADIVIGYDEVSTLAEKRLQNRLEDRRRRISSRNFEQYKKRLTLQPVPKLLTNEVNGTPTFSGTTDLPY